MALRWKGREGGGPGTGDGTLRVQVIAERVVLCGERTVGGYEAKVGMGRSLRVVWGLGANTGAAAATDHRRKKKAKPAAIRRYRTAYPRFTPLCGSPSNTPIEISVSMCLHHQINIHQTLSFIVMTQIRSLACRQSTSNKCCISLTS